MLRLGWAHVFELPRVPQYDSAHTRGGVFECTFPRTLKTINKCIVVSKLHVRGYASMGVHNCF